MKVYISNYRDHWLSPYKILEKVVFWKNWEEISYEEPWVEKWSDRIEPFSVALRKVLDFIHPKIDYIKVDRYDSWNADCTMARLCLPIMKQLKESKHGSGHIKDEDVPEHLRSTNCPPKEDEWDTDELYHERYKWVMEEIVWALGEVADPEQSWEQSFFNQQPGMELKFDREGYMEYSARIDNGLRLFGIYFRTFWD
jgi:hypothetical protein